VSAALVGPSLVPRPWCRYRVGRVEVVEDSTEEAKEAEVSPPLQSPRPACVSSCLSSPAAAFAAAAGPRSVGDAGRGCCSQVASAAEETAVLARDWVHRIREAAAACEHASRAPPAPLLRCCFNQMLPNV
jgi:hypothetical protein